MKTSLLTLLLVLNFISGFSQKYTYERGDARSTIVIKEKIREATLMSQLMPDYPADYFNQMINYVSVEIVTSSEGKTLTAISSGDALSQEQIQILNSADLGSDVFLKIKFFYKDSENDMRGSNNKIKEMEYAFLLAPHLEAAFPGAYPNLTRYLEEVLFSPVSSIKTADKILNVTMTFGINEEGQVIDPSLSGTTTYSNIDKMVVDAIQKMPNWKPAEDSKGNKVKQVFKLVFKFNSGGC